jgi:hypothetical protein
MSKPHLIVLRGAPDSGKTTTIGQLYLLMKNSNLGFYMLNADKKGARETKALIHTNGILIGILSAGDKHSFITDQLKRFMYLKCTIIVCACHSEGSKTHKAIEVLRKKSSSILYVDISKVQENYVAHKKVMARKIYSEVKRLMK